jgi:hypothetical protein
VKVGIYDKDQEYAKKLVDRLSYIREDIEFYYSKDKKEKGNTNIFIGGKDRKFAETFRGNGIYKYQPAKHILKEILSKVRYGTFNINADLYIIAAFNNRDIKSKISKIILESNIRKKEEEVLYINFSKIYDVPDFLNEIHKNTFSKVIYNYKNNKEIYSIVNKDYETGINYLLPCLNFLEYESLSLNDFVKILENYSKKYGVILIEYDDNFNSLYDFLVDIAKSKYILYDNTSNEKVEYLEDYFAIKDIKKIYVHKNKKAANIRADYVIKPNFKILPSGMIDEVLGE